MSETVWVVLGGGETIASGKRLASKLQHYVRVERGPDDVRWHELANIHESELSAVQDAATRLEAIAERKRLEHESAVQAVHAMRERAKTLEQRQ